MEADRLLRPLFAIVKAAHPRLPYYPLYAAQIVVQTNASDKEGDRSLFDLIPDDPALPTMGGVPMLSGVAGLRQVVKAGARVLLGWAGGDPSAPYCCSLFDDHVAVEQLLFRAESIVLGAGNGPAAEAGTEPTLRGTSYRSAQATLNAELIAQFTALATASTGALTPLAAGFTAIATALTKFEAQSATFPTTIVKVK